MLIISCLNWAIFTLVLNIYLTFMLLSMGYRIPLVVSSDLDVILNNTTTIKSHHMDVSKTIDVGVNSSTTSFNMLSSNITKYFHAVKEHIGMQTTRNIEKPALKSTSVLIRTTVSSSLTANSSKLNNDISLETQIKKPLPSSDTHTEVSSTPLAITTYSTITSRKTTLARILSNPFTKRSPPPNGTTSNKSLSRLSIDNSETYIHSLGARSGPTPSITIEVTPLNDTLITVYFSDVPRDFAVLINLPANSANNHSAIYISMTPVTPLSYSGTVTFLSSTYNTTVGFNIPASPNNAVITVDVPQGVDLPSELNPRKTKIRLVHLGVEQAANSPRSANPFSTISYPVQTVNSRNTNPTLVTPYRPAIFTATSTVVPTSASTSVPATTNFVRSQSTNVDNVTFEDINVPFFDTGTDTMTPTSKLHTTTDVNEKASVTTATSMLVPTVTHLFKTTIWDKVTSSGRTEPLFDIELDTTTPPPLSLSSKLETTTELAHTTSAPTTTDFTSSKSTVVNKVTSDVTTVPPFYTNSNAMTPPFTLQTTQLAKETSVTTVAPSVSMATKHNFGDKSITSDQLPTSTISMPFFFATTVATTPPEFIKSTKGTDKSNEITSTTMLTFENLTKTEPSKTTKLVTAVTATTPTSTESDATVRLSPPPSVTEKVLVTKTETPKSTKPGTEVTATTSTSTESDGTIILPPPSVTEKVLITMTCNEPNIPSVPLSHKTTLPSVFDSHFESTTANILTKQPDEPPNSTEVATTDTISTIKETLTAFPSASPDLMHSTSRPTYDTHVHSTIVPSSKETSSVQEILKTSTITLPGPSSSSLSTLLTTDNILSPSSASDATSWATDSVTTDATSIATDINVNDIFITKMHTTSLSQPKSHAASMATDFIPLSTTEIVQDVTLPTVFTPTRTFSTSKPIFVTKQSTRTFSFKPTAEVFTNIIPTTLFASMQNISASAITLSSDNSLSTSVSTATSFTPDTTFLNNDITVVNTTTSAVSTDTTITTTDTAASITNATTITDVTTFPTSIIAVITGTPGSTDKYSTGEATTVFTVKPVTSDLSVTSDTTMLTTTLSPLLTSIPESLPTPSILTLSEVSTRDTHSAKATIKWSIFPFPSETTTAEHYVHPKYWIRTVIQGTTDEVTNDTYKLQLKDILQTIYEEAFFVQQQQFLGVGQGKKRSIISYAVSVKIINVTTMENQTKEDLIEIVYYVRHNGSLILAKKAVKAVELLDDQIVALHFRHVVVIKAEPYLKDPTPEPYAHNEESSPVLLLVLLGSLAVLLLIILLAIVIYRFVCCKKCQSTHCVSFGHRNRQKAFEEEGTSSISVVGHAGEGKLEDSNVWSSSRRSLPIVFQQNENNPPPIPSRIKIRRPLPRPPGHVDYTNVASLHPSTSREQLITDVTEPSKHTRRKPKRTLVEVYKMDSIDDYDDVHSKRGVSGIFDYLQPPQSTVSKVSPNLSLEAAVEVPKPITPPQPLPRTTVAHTTGANEQKPHSGVNVKPMSTQTDNERNENQSKDRHLSADQTDSELMQAELQMQTMRQRMQEILDDAFSLLRNKSPRFRQTKLRPHSNSFSGFKDKEVSYTNRDSDGDKHPKSLPAQDFWMTTEKENYSSANRHEKRSGTWADRSTTRQVFSSKDEGPVGLHDFKVSFKEPTTPLYSPSLSKKLQEHLKAMESVEKRPIDKLSVMPPVNGFMNDVDIVSRLRPAQDVETQFLIRTIKDELQKFRNSMSAENSFV